MWGPLKMQSQILTLARLQLVLRSQTPQPNSSSQRGHITNVQLGLLQISDLYLKKLYYR